MKKSNLIKGLFTLAIFLVIAVIILSFIISPITNPFSSDQVITTEIVDFNPPDTSLKFHATTLSDDDCASCHTQPIFADCITCHPSPPVIINDEITFPHHDPLPGGPTDDCSSDVCHDADDDIRYVTILDASHDYCMQCHTQNQCWRCHGQGPP